MPDLSTNSVTASFKLSPSVFARVLIYWQERNIQFTSRSDMLRNTIEMFLKQNKVEDLTSAEIGAVLGDEVYTATQRQKAIQGIVSKAFSEEQKHIQTIQAAAEEEIALQDLLLEADEEEGTDD